MRTQLRHFFTAMMFYTRIPCPGWAWHGHVNGADELDLATVYFPVMGWIVAGIGAAVYTGALLLFTPELAILLSMIAQILATGAFHEDGFADVCDGFGGGWTKERILAIMKDSRVGAYGAIGIGAMLAVKFFALAALPPGEVVVLLLAAHSLSRATAATFIHTHAYVREHDDAKAKPIAKGITPVRMLVTIVLGVLPLALYPHLWGFIVLLPLAAVKFFFGRWFAKWIGGYTGDCLGAVQQTTEVVIYLFFIAMQRIV